MTALSPIYNNILPMGHNIYFFLRNITTAIIENLIECRSSVCNVAGPSGLMAWLLKKLRAKVIFEPNKLYASEILAICVQVCAGLYDRDVTLIVLCINIDENM